MLGIVVVDVVVVDVVVVAEEDMFDMLGQAKSRLLSTIILVWFGLVCAKTDLTPMLLLQLLLLLLHVHFWFDLVCAVTNTSQK
jgi:hypothetical protein